MEIAIVITILIATGTAIFFRDACMIGVKKIIATAINDAKSEHNLWNKFRNR
jgi:hypothetical protein